jgi:hypothetical protein
LSESRNAEVLFLWLRLAIANDYRPAMAPLERFLASQGRRKFVEPLYAELVRTPGGRELAHRVYAQARATYHTTTRQAVEVILGAR